MNTSRSPEEILQPGSLLPATGIGVQNPYRLLAICALILLAVGLVFGQTLRHDFVNFDDQIYVYENPQVVPGLTSQGIRWAFTSAHSGNWDPLTWISHMLDCQLFGLDAGGHHLTSVVLHGATAILLFLVLLRMTGWFWPSALVALMWAIHPLRVESVAWVAERKDVLSGFFFMLTLGAYVEYVRRPFSLARYLAVLVAFALGLMSKPMLVTLPCVLLLLDYWPLGRMAPLAAEDSRVCSTSVWRVGGFPFPMRLLIEKLPLLVLSVTSCGLTLWAQREGHGMTLNEVIPLLWRLGNAVVSTVAYLGQLMLPVDMAVFYPHPGVDLPAWKIASASLVLIGISVGVLAARRKHPYLLVGWLWYLGMLLPVIGLVQTGSHARADRFTYLPQVGLLIALVWGAAHLCRLWHRRRLIGVVSALIIIALMGCAWRQTSVWRNSETLWTHALAHTARNALAHNSLGFYLVGQGRFDEAITHYQKALVLDPMYAEAHHNLGLALFSQRRSNEAIAHYRKALAIQSAYFEAHNNLGNALSSRGHLEEATTHYRKALEINPNSVEAHNNLGTALARRGRVDEAMKQFRRALELKPDFADAQINIGIALAGQGRIDEAIAEYQKAVALAPNIAQIHNNLGKALAARGRKEQAVKHFRNALTINPNFLEARRNLENVLKGSAKQ